jgi:hypothetical protein
MFSIFIQGLVLIPFLFLATLLLPWGYLMTLGYWPKQLWGKNMILLGKGIVIWFAYGFLVIMLRLMPNPHMSLEKLDGLTSQEIIERFGKPAYDSRTDYTSPLQGSPFHLNYPDPWPWGDGISYEIEFKDNRVISIAVSYK